MSLQGNDRAITTSRAGVARAGAARVGFTPVDTKDEADFPGKGGHYIWTNVYGMKSQEIAITWTEVRR